jgi:hypothetical protein
MWECVSVLKLHFPFLISVERKNSSFANNFFSIPVGAALIDNNATCWGIFHSFKLHSFGCNDIFTIILVMRRLRWLRLMKMLLPIHKTNLLISLKVLLECYLKKMWR